MFCKVINLPLLLITLLTITSCAKLQPEQEVAKTQQALDVGMPSADSVALDLSTINYEAEGARAWWREFDDPVLHQLIEKALANSIDLKIAMTRLDEAMAAVRTSRADLYPTVNLETRTGVSTLDFSKDGLEFSPDRINTNTLDLRLAWQIDLFGQLRGVAASAKASLESQAHQVRDAQRLLVSQVAQSYYQIISIRERSKLIIESLKRRGENVMRINDLLEKGYATLVDKTRTDSQYYEAKAAHEELQLDEASALNQLSVLVSMNPYELRNNIRRVGQLFVPEKTLPLPTVAMLLTHRPDLRAAENDLRAAVHDVNSAKAALYPSLNFSANLGRGTGTEGTTRGAFPSLNSTVAGILMNVVTPVINRGRLLAAIDANSALLQQAHLVYENAVLRAVTQIDTAMVTTDKSHSIYEQRRRASKSAQQAETLSKELFKSGELDYTSVIVAEDTRVQAEQNAITAQTALVTSYITYLADVVPVW